MSSNITRKMDRDRLRAWHLCDHLSVEDAAYLMADVDPARDESMEEDPPNFAATFAALKNAINAGTLPAHIRGNVRASSFPTVLELPVT